jgi:hypothetical protein
VATNGEVFSDVGFNTPAGDMAEMLPAVAGPEPGDVLVDSSIPGHEMRCEGPPGCSGRTLGKALEGLDEGRGVVKMLVTLQ